jgi:Tfp pilus assembly protein PilP
MNKHLITTLMLVIACSVLSACAEEHAAQKASADIKPAANSHAGNAKAAAAGQKPATPNPSAAKEPAAKGSAKTSAAPAPDAAKTSAAPAPDAAKTSAAPVQDPKKVPAVPTAGTAKAPAAPASAKTPGAPAQTAVKVEDPPPALSVPAGFHYAPKGRRDPFINPVAKKEAAGGTDETPVPLIRPDGLPGVLVSEVKLSGILHSADKEMSKAMLVVGRNTYFAKRGDSLFDGVIKEIRQNEVVFTMVSATTRKPVNRDTVVRTGASSGTSAGEKK